MKEQPWESCSQKLGQCSSGAAVAAFTFVAALKTSDRNIEKQQTQQEQQVKKKLHIIVYVPTTLHTASILGMSKTYCNSEGRGQGSMVRSKQLLRQQKKARPVQLQLNRQLWPAQSLGTSRPVGFLFFQAWVPPIRTHNSSVQWTSCLLLGRLVSFHGLVLGGLQALLHLVHHGGPRGR